MIITCQAYLYNTIVCVKKYLLFLACLPFLARAQDHRLPQYPEVLHAFFSSYSFVQWDPTLGLQFAKKGDTWYVNIENLETEKIIKEQLFWSKSGGKYLPLVDFGPPADDPGPDIVNRLSGWPSFYSYSRSPYYGYAGWNYDVIRIYGSKNLNSLSDTLLDGMARAYSAYADQFLWQQFGGVLANDDTLKTQLKPGVMPSTKRLDSARYYIDKAIQVYALLAEKYPTYQTLVGSSGMKKYNEQVHGYVQMLLSNRKDLAKTYLQLSRPDQHYLQYAKNYLSWLPVNSILITSGDNDTYPLWYVQELENFRKDVTVINSNLLAFPPYIHYIARNNLVKFNTPSSVYLDSSFLYAIQKEGGNGLLEGQSIRDFIKEISAQVTANEEAPLYEAKWLKIELDVVMMEKFSGQKKLNKQMTIPLEDYISMDALMILDIVDQNFTKRPVYFTYPYDLFTNYLQKEGLVYRLLPLNPEEEEQNISYAMTKTGFFLTDHFQPVLSNITPDLVNPASNSDYETVRMYHDLILYYHDRGLTEYARNWFGKMKKVFAHGVPFSLMNNNLGRLYILMGEKQQGLALINDWADKLMANYLQPNALEPILGKGHLLDYLSSTRDFMRDLNLPFEKIQSLIDALQK